jgi:hypothetical protein
MSAKAQENMPFKCTTKIKEPLGLPPIRKSFEFPIIKTVDNYFDRQNKDLIKEIENINKSEEGIIDEDKAKKTEFKRAYDVSLKKTINLNELRKQLYGNLIVKKKKKTRKGKTSNYFYTVNNNLESLNPVYPVISPTIDTTPLPVKPPTTDNLVSDLEDKNEELDQMLNFVNNLDYDKYTQDLETREAIYLLKNKYEKDKEKFVPSAVDNKDAEVEEINQISPIKPVEPEPAVDDRFYLPPCNPLLHEKEWNNSVKPTDLGTTNYDEIVKQEIAQKILKEDKVKIS